MSTESIFTKIVRGKVATDILYQDQLVTAFRDTSPRAPTHILIVPNTEIPTLNQLTAQDEGLVGHMVVVAVQLAKKEGIAKDGYRLIINCNKHAGQEIFHLHLHLLGGSPLGPMAR